MVVLDVNSKLLAAQAVLGLLAWGYYWRSELPASEKYDTLFGEGVSAAADERAFIAGRWQFDGDKLNTLHHLGAGTFVASGKMVKALD